MRARYFAGRSAIFPESRDIFPSVATPVVNNVFVARDGVVARREEREDERDVEKSFYRGIDAVINTRQSRVASRRGLSR